jgi:phage I-like protein
MKTVLETLLCSLPDGPKAPEWIMLVPAGDIRTRDGRAFGNATPAEVVSAFKAERKDVPIDYEHATQILAPQGKAAPAVGWINEMDVRDGALWGKVAWTEEGRGHVESKAYRYISPVVHLGDTRDVVRVSSVALTNDPALYLEALSRRDQKEASMLKAIAKALGLKEEASETEVLAKISENTTQVELLTRQAEKPDVTKFVARADHDAVVLACSQQKVEIESLKKADTDKLVTAAVEEAIAGGKVIPAIKDSEIELCRAVGVEKYKERLSKMGAIITPGENDQTRKAAGEAKGGALTAEEIQMCSRLGLDQAEFKKTRDGEKAA